MDIPESFEALARTGKAYRAASDVRAGILIGPRGENLVEWSEADYKVVDALDAWNRAIVQMCSTLREAGCWGLAHEVHNLFYNGRYEEAEALVTRHLVRHFPK